MPSLWDSIAEDKIKDGLQTIRNESELRRQTHIAELRAHLAGGDRPRSSLTRFAAEDPDEYQERLAAFSHVGLMGMIGNELSGGVYGRAVKRNITNSPGANDQYQKTITQTRLDTNQILIGLDQVGVGNSFVAVQFSPQLNRVVLPIVAMENVFVERIPENPFEMFSLIEQRADPNRPKKIANWIWTTERYRVVDEDGADIPWFGADGEMHSGWTPNPYGVIPYAHWRGRPWAGEFWGQSLLEDTLQLNKLINNRLSDLSVIIAHQAFSQGWVRNMGTAAAKKENRIAVGPRRFVPLDEGGEMGYAQPDAPITESFSTIEKLMEWCVRLAALPTSVVRDGSAASGYALEVEFRSMKNVVDMLIRQAIGAENRLARCWCAVAGAHPKIYRGIPKYDDAEIAIEFDVDFLPRDRQMEKDSARLDWQAGLMLTGDYVRQYILPTEKDEAKIANYVSLLDAQNAAKAAQANPFGPAPMVPPEQRAGLI